MRRNDAKLITGCASTGGTEHSQINPAVDGRRLVDTSVTVFGESR